MPSRKVKRTELSSHLNGSASLARHFPALGILAQGVDVRLLFDAAGLEGEAEGPLQRGAAHRFGGGAGALAAMALGGKEQCGMAMRFPLLAQEQQGALGQWDVAIPIAFASPDVEKHPFGIDVTDLEIQTFAQAQPTGVNGD